MNNPAMLITLTVLLSSLLVAYGYFAYRYARYSPWNATWQGITLEAQKITMASLVGFFIVDGFFPEGYPGRYSILVILLTLLSIEAWATLLGLLYVQRRGGKVRHALGMGYVDPNRLDPK